MISHKKLCNKLYGHNCLQNLCNFRGFIVWRQLLGKIYNFRVTELRSQLATTQRSIKNVEQENPLCYDSAPF